MPARSAYQPKLSFLIPDICYSVARPFAREFSFKHGRYSRNFGLVCCIWFGVRWSLLSGVGWGERSELKLAVVVVARPHDNIHRWLGHILSVSSGYFPLAEEQGFRDGLELFATCHNLSLGRKCQDGNYRRNFVLPTSTLLVFTGVKVHVVGSCIGGIRRFPKVLTLENLWYV